MAKIAIIDDDPDILDASSIGAYFQRIMRLLLHQIQTMDIKSLRINLRILSFLM